jgi:hypothetical protein
LIVMSRGHGGRQIVRRSSARAAWHGLRIALVVALGASTASVVHAQDTPAQRDPTREIWAGVIVGKDYWSLHTAFGWAPFSSLYDTGLRFRTTAGYAAYRYTGNRFDPITTNAVRRSFKGTTAFGDVLVGYQVRWRSLTAKVYGGAAYEAAQTTPIDDEAYGLGRRWAHKVAVETWWDATRALWVAFDGQWTGLDDRYEAKLRIGYKLTETLSVGVLGGVRRNAFEQDRSLGGFLRLDTGRFEWTLSGSMTDAKDRASGLAVMVQGLVRF